MSARRFLAALPAFLALWAAALAQGPGNPMPNYPFQSFRFNFINPGARASGMGQAYIALADDATGAETNPAGLCALVQPQFFVEGRNIRNRFDNLYLQDADTVGREDVWTGKYSPTFVSLVFPFRQWAVSAYRQELANYDLGKTQDSFTVPGVLFLGQYPVTLNTYTTDISLKTVNWGLSLSRRWGERVNVGFSARATEVSLDTRETVPASELGPAYAVPAGDVSARMMRCRGSALSWSWTAGFIVKPVDWLRIGGVFRSGSSHRLEMVFNENLFLKLNNQPLRSTMDFDLRVPRRWGVGVAVSPDDRTVVTCDFVRIDYSEMTPAFTGYIQREFRDDYAFADGTSFRLGFERTFILGRTPLALRAGYYSDPDNTLHFVGDRSHNDVIYFAGLYHPADEVYSNFESLQGMIFSEAGTDHHFTFGAGVTVKNHLQLEFAGDLASARTNLVLSVLYNF